MSPVHPANTSLVVVVVYLIDMLSNLLHLFSFKRIPAVAVTVAVVRCCVIRRIQLRIGTAFAGASYGYRSQRISQRRRTRWTGSRAFCQHWQRDADGTCRQDKANRRSERRHCDGCQKTAKADNIDRWRGFSNGKWACDSPPSQLPFIVTGCQRMIASLCHRFLGINLWSLTVLCHGISHAVSESVAGSPMHENCLSDVCLSDVCHIHRA